ncbi:MAG: helix-turn-helix domain-containing protein [Planctomycetota bacterium]
MASGTRTRPFLRQLEATGCPFYVIGADGTLVFLSAGCSNWLQVDLESLLERRCVAGSAVSDDPLDRLAASLSAPTGIASRGTASLRVQPPPVGDVRAEPMEVRFTRVGQAESAITIAVAGHFDDRTADHDLRDAVGVRQQLDLWRKHHAELAHLATAGQSPSVRGLRRRLRVAASVRTDFCLFGRIGCGGESIARRIHHAHVENESITAVDGSLMDPELLDAVLSPVIHPLTDSRQAVATVLVRSVDEMPVEAQTRLVEIWNTFESRLRVIGLSGPSPAVFTQSRSDTDQQPLIVEDDAPSGICSELWEILSAFTVNVEPLSNRTEDIPVLATALLDRRRASNEGSAERFSRAALDALVIYPWPGDFQELDDAVRHAIRASRGETIGVEQLPLAIRSFRPGEGSLATRQLNLSLDDAMSRFELRMIQQALKAAAGNRAEAARRLGISRARLIRRIDAKDENE